MSGQDSLLQRFAAWAPLMLLAVLFAVAYRALLDFTPISPALESREGGVGVDLFVPNEKPPLLFFGLSAYFCVTRFGALRQSVGQKGAEVVSTVLLVLGLCLQFWSNKTGELPLGLVSLSLLLLGVAGILGGREGFVRMRLPALILLLALPVPSTFLNSLIHSMQLFTATSTGEILSLFGVQNVVFGDTIYSANTAFRVIEGCSGLRAVESLVMTAIVYQGLLPYSRLVSWLLVLTAPIFGIVINQLRVLSIVLDPNVLPDQDHSLQGLVMIVAGVLMVTGFSLLLERFLPRTLSPELSAVGTEPATVIWPWKRFVGVVLLLGALISATVVEPWAVDRPDHRNPTRLPGQFGGWRAEVEEIDDLYWGSTHHTQSISRTYRRGEDQVRVFIGVDTRKKSLLSGVSPKIHPLGDGWRIVERNRISFKAADGIEVWASVQQRVDAAAYVVSWEQGVDPSLLREGIWNMLALDRSPWQRPYVATSIRVSTQVAGFDAYAKHEARKRIQPIVDQIRETFPIPGSREREPVGDGS